MVNQKGLANYNPIYRASSKVRVVMINQTSTAKPYDPKLEFR